MGFEDKVLQCSDCGTNFTFSSSEQELFASKGYVNQPKRCPSCRQARKATRVADGGGMYGASPRRRMYPVTCAQCGKQAEVPFEPREGRPVYCSDCYSRVRSS